MTATILQAPQFKRIMSVVVPAILIAALSVYVLAFRAKQNEAPKVLVGKPLAAYEEFYPIRANETGGLILDKVVFEKAIEHFSTDNTSPRAIADLVYLGAANNVTLMLGSSAKSKFIKLSESPDYAAAAETDRQKDKLFQTYIDIVNGVGQTFAGTPIEIVLHDTRNPLKSVAALQNPISGRRIGDTNTNFGIQLIKNYSLAGKGQGSSFVSYGLKLKDGRAVKSTTIPLFDDTYGLIGFICINIDISKMDGKDPMAVDHFIENFRSITENEAISEMIQNSKRKS